jgi:hypothetical protein
MSLGVVATVTVTPTTVTVTPTGDYAKNMEKLLAFYKTTTPKHPHEGTAD